MGETLLYLLVVALAVTAVFNYQARKDLEKRLDATHFTLTVSLLDSEVASDLREKFQENYEELPPEKGDFDYDASNVVWRGQAYRAMAAVELMYVSSGGNIEDLARILHGRAMKSRLSS